MKGTPNPTRRALAPTSRTVDVTPEIAAKWLTDNTHNRRMNERLVETYAGAMRRGEWKENGDSIRFSVPPRVLLDGQKRLAAVVKSGVTIRTFVVENLDHPVQRTIDVVQRRSFGNTLDLAGETQWTTMAALVSKVYAWHTGQIRFAGRPATYDQLMDIYEAEKSLLEEAIQAAGSVRRYLRVSGATMGLLYYLLAPIDDEDCDFFFARLRDGQGLVEGDPIFALRKTLLANLAQPAGRGRMSDQMLLAVVIKAWNAYRNGEKVKVLSWRAGGASPEPFPTPK